jgi:hypothetical protein
MFKTLNAALISLNDAECGSSTQASNKGCGLEWVDVGTRPKVRWINVVFDEKIRKIEKKVLIELTFIGKVMLFRIIHCIRVKNLFFFFTI